MKKHFFIILILGSFITAEGQKINTGIFKSEIKPRNGNQPVETPPVNPLEFTKFKAELWPNPTSSSFNLKIDSPSDDVLRIYITDLTGKEVTRFKVPKKETISFGEEFSRGLYFLKIMQDKEKKATMKIIKL